SPVRTIAGIFVLELLSQARDDLKPVEAVRQVVVGDDEVRNGPLRCQLECFAPHRRRPRCDDPRHQEAAAAARVLPDRPRRPGWSRGTTCTPAPRTVRAPGRPRPRLAPAAPRR